MVRIYLIIILIGLVEVSCRAPFEPDIEIPKKVLVIDGFITNRINASYIKLSYAVPYDSVGSAKIIRHATVYVTDNTNKVTFFRESKPGFYESEAFFAGVINRSYVLTVILPNGEEYYSSPQMMLPTLEPDSVYAGFNKVDSLEVEDWGNVTKVVSDVCEVYYDIKSDNQERPHFRFTSSQLIEYIKSIMIESTSPMSAPRLIVLFCWMTENDNSLRFTSEKYASNIIDLIKQPTCVTTVTRDLYVRDISLDTWDYVDTIVHELEYNRIITINQFRLNDDAYRFYKGVENQSNAEGKIFDPILTQLYGNMRCKQDSTRLVFGFFEVSSVSTNSYSVRRNGLSQPIVIKKVNGPFLTSFGFTEGDKPALWIKL